MLTRSGPRRTSVSGSPRASPCWLRSATAPRCGRRAGGGRRELLLREFAVAVGIGLVEPLGGSHRPLLERQQVVSVLVELAERVGARRQHLLARNPLIAIAVIAKEALLFAREFGGFGRLGSTQAGHVGTRQAGRRSARRHWRRRALFNFCAPLQPE